MPIKLRKKHENPKSSYVKKFFSKSPIAVRKRLKPLIHLNFTDFRAAENPPRKITVIKNKLFCY